MNTPPSPPEPWLRGTLTDVPAVPRAVLHALQLAQEDLARWCSSLNATQLNTNVGDIPPVAFHLCHIARSLDRLLTYAEGQPLTPGQTSALQTESAPHAEGDALFFELEAAFARSAQRVRAFTNADLEKPCVVGKRQLPTTLGGLLVHIAEHTQRHVGQAITTAKLVIHLQNS